MPAITIKEKKPGQRACDEKNEKGELCVGHLKRWYQAPADVIAQVGKEVYRCERCHMLYKPAATDDSSVGLRYEERPVTLLGGFLRRRRRG